MASLMKTLMGNAQITDQVIANDAIMGAKGAAQAYLNATLESATPELRALYAANLNKAIAAHAGIVELAVKRGWYKPYDVPEQQLSEIYRQSETLVAQSAEQ